MHVHLGLRLVAHLDAVHQARLEQRGLKLLERDLANVRDRPEKRPRRGDEQTRRRRVYEGGVGKQLADGLRGPIVVGFLTATRTSATAAFALSRPSLRDGLGVARRARLGRFPGSRFGLEVLPSPELFLPPSAQNRAACERSARSSSRTPRAAARVDAAAAAAAAAEAPTWTPRATTTPDEANPAALLTECAHACTWGAPRAAATPESPVALVTSALVSSAAMAVVSPRASARFTTPAADLMSTRERRDPRAESVVVLSARKDLDSIQNRGPLPTFSLNRRVAVPTARAGAVEGA